MFRLAHARSVGNIARANTREAFETIWASPKLIDEYLEPDRLRFYEEVADVCAQFHVRSIVDIGCGTGHLLAAIVARSPGLEKVVGVDYASSAITQLSHNVPYAQGVVADVFGLDTDALGTFDLVVCTELLEHVQAPERALEILCRLRGPAGRLIVTVPDGAVDRYAGHVNFWTEAAFAEFLRVGGPSTTRRIAGEALMGIVEDG